MSSYTAVAYLQIEPEWWSDGSVRRVKVARMTKNFPVDPIPWARVVKVKVQVDGAIFSTLEAEVVVESTEANPVMTGELADADPKEGR